MIKIAKKRKPLPGTGGAFAASGTSVKKAFKSWGSYKTKKKTKQKEKYLVSLKREKELAGIGWKVKRTKSYTEKPKEATSKKGYPYAVLNKEKNYETFYTWKDKPSKKRKGTIRHEAFKAQQAKLHKKSQRKVKIKSLKKSRKRKF